MNWLTKLATAEDYLRSMNADPDVVQWIMGLVPEDRQWYINQVAKNPGITLIDMQQTDPPFTLRSEMTEEEGQLAMDFAANNQLYNWVKVQLRRLRKGNIQKRMNEPGNPTYYEYQERISEIHRNMIFIEAWYDDIDYHNGKHPELASYSYQEALEAAIEWDRKPKTEQFKYDNSQVPLYSPPEWGGWSIVAMTSANDLEAEGEKMHHCSGIYCEDVYSGSMYLLSLRDKYNNPHVTIQIAGGGNVSQIYGYGNSDPKPEYQRKIKEFFTHGRDQLFKFTGEELNLHTQRGAGRYIQDILDLDVPDMAAKISELISVNEYGLPYDISQLGYRMERMYQSILPDIMRTYFVYRSIRLNEQDTYAIQDLGKAMAELAYTIDSRYKNITDLETGEQVRPNAVKFLNYAVGSSDEAYATNAASIFTDAIRDRLKELKGEPARVTEYR